MTSASGGAAEALSFCRSSDSAVVATVWPTASSQVDVARQWLLESGAMMIYETPVDVAQESGPLACMALYHGEEWLESNCWYMESPLPNGPPEGPWPGAKWKAELAFSKHAPLHVFVVDASGASRMWSGKYSIRDRMRKAVGTIGNSCLHLTDDQSGELNKWRAGQASKGGRGGMDCDSSYAYHCARVLLNPHSVAFLNAAGAACGNLSDRALLERFEGYCRWLGDPLFADVDSATGSFTPPPCF